MPSIAKTLNNPPVAPATESINIFATEKPNAKIIPTQIIVDNEAGLAPRVIRIQDLFATDDSVIAATGVAVPGTLPATPKVVDRLIITVDNGSWATIAAEALKELEILGQLQVTIDELTAVGTRAIVTISWGFQ